MSAAELKSLIELLGSRPAPEKPSVDQMRERFDQLAKFLPTPQDATCRQLDANGVPAEMVAAPGTDEGRVVLYLHGGGYVIGSLNTHRNLAYNVSAASGASTLLIDYRLAPEYPFPAQVDDAVAAYRWLLDQGSDPQRLAMAGDSAGGGLVVAALLACKQRGLPMPSAAVCISPWVDMEAIGESMSTKAAADPMVQREGLLHFARLFLGKADARNPLAAPMYGDLQGLPPLLIQVGTAETLLDDAVRLAERAQVAGVTVSLEQTANMIHVWHLFAPMLSEGHDAIARAGAFLRAHAP